MVERANARAIEPSELKYRPQLATADVSFISLTKILPAIASCLSAEGELLALVKPQFEARARPRGQGRRRARDGGPP